MKHVGPISNHFLDEQARQRGLYSPLNGKVTPEQEIPQPRDRNRVLLLGDLDLERDTLLEGRVDVDRVRERFRIEVRHDLLEAKFGAIGTSDGETEEGVEVEGEERPIGFGCGEQEDGDLDKVRLDV